MSVVEPIDGSTMDKFDFECLLYVYTNKSVTFKKGDEAIKREVRIIISFA